MLEISPWHLFIVGGPLMWPLFLVSVFAWAIVIEKIMFFRKIDDDGEQLVLAIMTSLRKNDLKAAMTACDHAGTPLAGVLKNGVLYYGRNRAELENAFAEAARLEIPLLESRLPALLIIGNMAPVLGFLGTAIAMGDVFYTALIRSQALNPMTAAMFSARLAEALILTVAGFLVMIPSLLAYGYCFSKVEDHVLSMEKAVMTLLNFLSPLSGPDLPAVEE